MWESLIPAEKVIREGDKHLSGPYKGKTKKRKYEYEWTGAIMNARITRATFHHVRVRVRVQGYDVMCAPAISFAAQLVNPIENVLKGKLISGWLIISW